jgi:L-ribulokinase
MPKDCFVIGVDYGTDSVRTIIVNAANGNEVASDVFIYPRWSDNLYCDPEHQVFRQHPLDYVEGLEQTIRNCLQKAGGSIKDSIAAISLDTTGSTPVAVDRGGTPLSLHSEFSEDPDAMFVLWKDHSSYLQADRINNHAKNFDTDYLQFVGGIYSSEWFWSKLLHIFSINERVRKATHSWVEHCDWMPYLLTGGNDVTQMKRSVCTAGHKALWSDKWGGLPPQDFFTSLDPLLTGITARLYKSTYTADQAAGTLSAEWAARLGLTEKVVVGIGAMDAHMGAVGGQIEPYYLSKVIGTSTCDMLVAPSSEASHIFVRGICGVVDGSIIPGMIGMEAGQSAFGDVYAWFRQLLSWPLKYLPGLSGKLGKDEINKLTDHLIPELSRRAGELELSDHLELSVDWFNGRRTPDANAHVKGAITGLHLGTDAVAVFRSLAEATCFGAKAIVERFRDQQVPVKGLIGIGGVARKSPFIMQMLADVINMPIRMNRSEQTCALGAAMFAATVCGYYRKVEDAMNAMGQGFGENFSPNAERAKIYERRYARYLSLGNFIQQTADSEI